MKIVCPLILLILAVLIAPPLSVPKVKAEDTGAIVCLVVVIACPSAPVNLNLGDSVNSTSRSMGASE